MIQTIRAHSSPAEIEPQFYMLMENSFDLYCMTDEFGQIVYTNPAFQKTLGYSSTDLENLNSGEIVHPDDIEKTFDWRPGKPFVFRMRTRQGRWLWMEGVCYRICIQGVNCIVNSARDITARKAADEQLKKQKKNSEILFEISCLLSGNRSNYHAVLKMTAQRLAELIGDDALIRLVSEDGNIMDEAGFFHTNPRAQEFLRLIADHPQRIDEGLVGKIRQSGEPIYMPFVNQQELLSLLKPEYREFFESFVAYSFLMVPLKYEDRLLGVINMVRSRPGCPYTREDLRLLETIADQVALALENARLYNEKISEIEERRRAEKELKKALMNLAATNKEMQEFVYAASHDLQEPLRMVASYTRLLEKRYKDQLDENASVFIDYAVDGARRMQQLIGDLLTYSRITTRANPFEPVDTNEVVLSLLSCYSSRISEFGIKVTVGELPVIMADAAQMRQLFDHLLNNAIKFRKPDSPRLLIDAVQVGGEWQFMVKDNGIGINAPDKERIFIIFQRLHEKELYPGNGTGLAICKKIVERHNGRIWVESVVNEGSVFYFTLPGNGV